MLLTCMRPKYSSYLSWRRHTNDYMISTQTSINTNPIYANASRNCYLGNGGWGGPRMFANHLFFGYIVCVCVWVRCFLLIDFVQQTSFGHTEWPGRKCPLSDLWARRIYYVRRACAFVPSGIFASNDSVCYTRFDRQARGRAQP